MATGNYDVVLTAFNYSLLWREAEIEVFGKHGVHLTEVDCMQTTGMRIGEVTRFWFERKPWNGPAPEILAEEILNGVIRRVQERGKAMPGLYDAVRLFRSRGWKLALASSSAMPLIDTVMDRLDLRRCFDGMYSAEDESHGKPHPDVYLTAARKLGTPPETCLAIEDSIAGVAAAKAAGMKCIAVPLTELREDSRYRIADIIIDSLVDINSTIIDYIEFYF